MKYETIKHKKSNFYMQIEKATGMPVVIYYFNNQNGNELNAVTVIEEPDYYVLPNRGEKSGNTFFNFDYVLDLSAFKDFDEPIVVSTGNSIVLTNNLNTNVELVLSSNQDVYGALEKSFFNESVGYVIIKNREESNDKDYHKGFFPFTRNCHLHKIDDADETDPRYHFYAGLKINRAIE